MGTLAAPANFKQLLNPTVPRVMELVDSTLLLLVLSLARRPITTEMLVWEALELSWIFNPRAAQDGNKRELQLVISQLSMMEVILVVEVVVITITNNNSNIITTLMTILLNL